MPANNFENDPHLSSILDENQHIKAELKKCLMEGSIRKKINEHIELSDLQTDKQAIWSYLVLNGLLTYKPISSPNTSELYDLFPPNFEAGLFLVKTILRWENRFLSPAQVASGDYSFLDEKKRMFFSCPKSTPTPAASPATESKTVTPATKTTATESKNTTSDSSFGNTLTGLRGAFSGKK